MRISLIRYAPLVVSLVVLAGCKGSESGWNAPSWSLWNLNPFSWASGVASTPRPATPASQAFPPASPTYPTAGFAAAASDTAEPAPQYREPSPAYGTSANDSSAPLYGYPSGNSTGGYGSPADSAGSARSPVGLQNGFYPAGSYGSAGPSSAATSGSSLGPSQYSAGDNSSLFGSPAGSGYPSGNGDRNVAGATGPYGYGTGSAARLGSDADRYGADRATTSPESLSPAYRSPATSGLDAEAASGLRNRLPDAAGATPDRYSAPANGQTASRSSSVAGDRYGGTATGSTGTASGYGAYVNGQFSNTEGDPSWNPGGPTPNMPGRMDYDPGKTDFNPPGVPPYRSSIDSSILPGGSNESTASFFPGSTKPLIRRDRTSDTPEQGLTPDSAARPRTDSYGSPLDYARQPSGARF